MRRKNRKIKKVVADKPSVSNSVESDASDKICNYNESIEGDGPKADKEVFNDNNSSSVKTDESELSVGLIKLEKLDIDTRSTCSSNEEKKSESLSATIDMVSDDSTFLFVELKLISIDNKCKNFKKLTQTFLCLNANALIEHIQKLIYKKMMLSDSFFEIVLMCNGYEAKSTCPLLFLKKQFFPKEEKISLYYAIVERSCESFEEQSLSHQVHS